MPSDRQPLRAALSVVQLPSLGAASYETDCGLRPLGCRESTRERECRMRVALRPDLVPCNLCMYSGTLVFKPVGPKLCRYSFQGS